MHQKMAHIIFTQVCILLPGVSFGRSFSFNDSVTEQRDDQANLAGLNRRWGYNLSLRINSTGSECHPGMQLNYSRIRWQPPCKEDFFRCLDGTLCNSKKKLCDGNKDCSYGEDELSCLSVNNESRVETWLWIIVLLLLALVLEKCVFKKVFSWLKATHSGEVEGKRAEDQELTARTEDEFDTDNTDIMHEGDESPELNEQVCTAETRGACVHRGDLPFQVQGDLVVHMNMSTVNMNTMSMNVNTTNHVELQQNGGVTVVGDKANINYYQPSQE